MNDERTILCFGDSNTFGAPPGGGARFDRNTRWPCVLQQELGDGYYVVEAGLCGRTTVWDDPVEDHKNGLKQLIPVVQSHEPLDLVILMLGTNDLKDALGLSAMDVASSVGQLVKTIRTCTYPPTGQVPDVLVVCPPPFASMEATPFEALFQDAEEKSHELASAFRTVAEQGGFRLFNAGDVVQCSTKDGIHLEASEHMKLGKILACEIMGIIHSPVLCETDELVYADQP